MVLNIPCVVVVIDFIDAPYEVNETDVVALVTVGVVSSGQLMREVGVELSFSDGTAIGKQAVFVGCGANCEQINYHNVGGGGIIIIICA